MADSRDVRTVIAGLIGAAIYPAAIAPANSIPGFTGGVAIFPSDIKPADIDTRVGNGDILIGVIEFGDARSTKRFPPVDRVVFTPAATLAWTQAVSGATVTLTLSGAVSSPQNVAVIINGSSDIGHGVQLTDTLAIIVSALAASGTALALPGVTFSASGAALSITGAHLIVGRVGVIVQTVREVGRQVSHYVVSVWAQTDALAAATTRVVRSALDDQRRMVMPDYSGAWIGDAYEMPVYEPKKLGLTRVNVRYAVEYASTVQSTAAQLIVWRTDFQGGAVPLGSVTPTQPPPLVYES
jgi:hypothetical protein